ncbi:MAG: MarR family transcriptional regulator [Pseudomonadota bacterium]
MTSKNFPKHLLERFISCNSKIRLATLASEQEFLNLAGKINAAQLQLILAIGTCENCSMKYLAQILGSSPANISQMIKRLQVKKFVSCTRDVTDRRASQVRLLSKGQKIYQAHRQHVLRVTKQWFAKMSHDEQLFFLEIWERLCQ